MSRKRIRSHYPITSGTGSLPGPPIGGNEGLLITDAIGSFKIQQNESNGSLSTLEAFNLNTTSNETNSTSTETNIFQLSGAQFNESNTTPVDVYNSFLRCWASSTTDNDSSRTTPTNANGQNDGTNAIIKTNNALGDLTNPVVLTSSSFNVLSSGTFTSKKIRAYFSIPARVLNTDTIFLAYNIGASDVHFYNHGTIITLVDHSSGDFTFDISGLTLAQLSTIQLKASYQSVLVAVPQTQINLDAWEIELEGGL